MSVRIKYGGGVNTSGSASDKEKNKYGGGHNKALSKRLLDDDDDDQDDISFKKKSSHQDLLGKGKPLLNFEDIENPLTGPTQK